jgi:predicted transcriptional regulator
MSTTSAKLTIEFKGITQEQLIDGLARHFGYVEKTRQPAETGGYEYVANPQTKEEFVISRVKPKLAEQFRNGTAELEGDRAKAAVGEKYTDI